MLFLAYQTGVQIKCLISNHIGKHNAHGLTKLVEAPSQVEIDLQ